MQRIFIISLVSLFLLAVTGPAQSYPGGIVYGSKAAFAIAAPNGWVLDNESGARDGLPCVLYPKGSTWSDARTVIYAKIAGTKFEDANEFVEFSIKDMASTRGQPKEKIASGKTRDGHAWFINEYPATKDYSQWERVAYVQLPHAVAYIVLSSRDQTNYRKDSAALEEVLKTFVYMDPDKARTEKQN